ncbi:FAD-binding oxidoreductase [Actinocrispum wychmicini]|uniref:FAD/FMN-containing dehydrogenase n=1 Tax=Actinocrispum wychmicini TaxID=1213861 RepID=A0A4R2JD40_9PSEU|nr:FAD-binding oxidoreductase [Actinocrispum wychmicini]TCO55982.1 FAD/FMN-containing dehydrogenase [Actinocrispum wychmicini]
MDTSLDTGPFQGDLVRPGDPGYEQARKVWNLAVDRHPAGVARCHTTEDVVAALDLARRANLAVSVRGGGHSFPGFSTTDGGLVLDLSPMHRILVDAADRIATVQPGVRWGQLTDATAAHGLVGVGGHVADVGVIGLLLGGGNGWLVRSFGLACDNLVSAEVVTADGQVVTANADENPDLFWGLRGGGGNFGIVTQATLRLHPLTDLLGGMLLYRLEDAAEVLRFIATFDAPTDLNVAPAILAAPEAPFVPVDLHGKPVLAVAVCYVGAIADGEQALVPLRALMTPVADLVQPTSFRDLQHFFDPQGESTPYHMRSHIGGPITDDLIAAMLDFGGRFTSPGNITLLLPMGGAAAAVPPDATAFRHRDGSYVMEIAAAWQPDDPAPDTHRSWADGLWAAARPWATGVEVNHLADEGLDRVRAAYGDNFPRLAELKRTWDPQNVFHLNQNIPPAG